MTPVTSESWVAKDAGVESGPGLDEYRLAYHFYEARGPAGRTMSTIGCSPNRNSRGIICVPRRDLQRQHIGARFCGRERPRRHPACRKMADGEGPFASRRHAGAQRPATSQNYSTSQA